MPKLEVSSELVAAAAALDAELTRFEESTASFRRQPLSSQKNLERATKSLNDLADGEQRLAEQVQALVKAIATARDRQLAQVEWIRLKAEEIKARSLDFQGLQERFKALGDGAAELNVRLQQGVAGAPLAGLDAEMGELAASAKGLAETATTRQFDDVARLADGLRQQILSARGKLRLLDRSLPSA